MYRYTYMFFFQILMLKLFDITKKTVEENKKPGLTYVKKFLF